MVILYIGPIYMYMVEGGGENEFAWQSSMSVSSAILRLIEIYQNFEEETDQHIHHGPHSLCKGRTKED